uniref:Coiled-coil domain containing 34 n=1 Tax=Oreochromis aureus TaxID=47969 RepID=A0A668VZR6_OREAU
MPLNTYFHIASPVSGIGISDLCVSLPISFTFYIRKQKTLSVLCSLLCCPLQICWLVMSGERLPKGFSSTPLKDFQPSKGFGDGILSDEEDTFSLLSPIYHDSFDSDEEDLRSIPDQQTTSPRERDDSRLSISPLRCCRKALDRVLASSPTLSAWEMWLVNKAKEERLKQEKKVEKERLLKEKKEKQQREQEQKKLIMDEKIQEWLKLKTEQVNNYLSKIEVKAVLNMKKKAFRSKVKEEMKAAQQEVKRCLREAKDTYRRKVEQKLERNNMREVWNGVKTITGHNTKNSTVETVEKANELNNFFNRFDQPTAPPPSPFTTEPSPYSPTSLVRRQLRKLPPERQQAQTRCVLGC